MVHFYSSTADFLENIEDPNGMLYVQSQEEIFWRQYTQEYSFVDIDTLFHEQVQADEEKIEEITITPLEWSKKEERASTIKLAELMYMVTYGEIMRYSPIDDSLYSNLVPEVLIGGLPLYCVQRIERGMSDREIKYRAVGDVFLAHQKGTTDTLRIDGTFTGPFRNMYVIFLLGLQYKTEGTSKSLANIEKGILSEEAVPSNKTETGTLKDDQTVDYETHKTFPIITQTAIVLDMYLQTIEWDLSVESGIECIKYHLLFRKYIDPKGWEAFKDGSKKGRLTYGDSKLEAIRKETLIDAMWKTKKMLQELYYPVWLKTDNQTRLNMEAVSTFPYGVDIQKIGAGAIIEVTDAYNNNFTKSIGTISPTGF